MSKTIIAIHALFVLGATVGLYAQHTGSFTGRQLSPSIGGHRDQRTFNVRDYGAVVNGVSNDAGAIQAALDAAHHSGGGIVYVPSGTSLISSPLRIYSNSALVGAGKDMSIIKARSDWSGFSLIRFPSRADYVAIRNISIDGNRQAQPYHKGYENISTYSSDSSFCMLKHLTIENADIRNSSDFGLDIEGAGSSFITVKNTMFYSCGDTLNSGCIYLTGQGGGTSDVLIQDCWMDSSYHTAIYSAYGANRVKILHNQIRWAGIRKQIGQGISFRGNDCIISQNTIYGCYSEGMSVQQPPLADSWVNCCNVTVENNFIWGNLNANDGAARAQICLLKTDGVIVKENHIGRSYGTGEQYGIRVMTRNKNLQIKNNIITTDAVASIYLTDSLYNVDVTGNIMKCPSVDSLQSDSLLTEGVRLGKGEPGDVGSFIRIENNLIDSVITGIEIKPAPTTYNNIIIRNNQITRWQNFRIYGTAAGTNNYISAARAGTTMQGSHTKLTFVSVIVFVILGVILFVALKTEEVR